MPSRWVFLFSIWVILGMGVVACTKTEKLHPEEVQAALQAAKREIWDPKALMPEWYRAGLKADYIKITEKNVDFLTTTYDQQAKPRVELVPYYQALVLSLLIYAGVAYTLVYCGWGWGRDRSVQAFFRIGIRLFAITYLSIFLQFFLVFLVFGRERFIPWHFAAFLGHTTVSVIGVSVAAYAFFKSRTRRQLEALKQLRKQFPGGAEIGGLLDEVITGFESLLILYGRTERRKEQRVLMNEIKATLLVSTPSLLAEALPNLDGGSQPSSDLQARLYLIKDAMARLDQQLKKNRMVPDDGRSEKLRTLVETGETIEERLARLERQLRRRNAAGAERLAEIGKRVLDLRENAGSFSEIDRITLDKIATSYLPDAVDKYMSLPESANLPSRGKPADALLEEQLDILIKALRNMQDSLILENRKELAIHGRFLKDKFADTGINFE